jgi:hypothetical protein
MIGDIQLKCRGSLPIHIQPWLKAEFEKLAALEPLERTKTILPYIPQDDTPNSCLTCLLSMPSNSLTCGHRLCDTCTLHYLHHDSLHKCPVCAHTNIASLHPKPTTAGSRILVLGGKISEGRQVASLLKNLRSRLCGPLEFYFDLVVCSGVGIYFAVMMLCNRASIEDCMYHLDSMGKLKVDKTGFSFGSRLKFCFSELQRSQVKIVLSLKKRAVASYR